MLSNSKKNRKSQWRKNFFMHVGGVLVLLVLAILVVANIKMYQTHREYLGQVASLKTQIEQLQSENGSLNQGIDNSSSPQYMETVAREQLDLQKPGETVVSFVMPKTDQQNSGNPQKNVWQGWLGGAWAWVKSWY